MAIDFSLFNPVEKLVQTAKTVFSDKPEFEKEFPLLGEILNRMVSNSIQGAKPECKPIDFKDLYFATVDMNALYNELYRYSKLAAGCQDYAVYKYKNRSYKTMLKDFGEACLKEFGNDILYLFVPEIARSENKFIKDEEFLKIYRKMFRTGYFAKVCENNYSSHIDCLLASCARAHEKGEIEYKSGDLYDLYNLIDKQLKSIYNKIKEDIDFSKGKKTTEFRSKTDKTTKHNNIFDELDSFLNWYLKY